MKKIITASFAIFAAACASAQDVYPRMIGFTDDATSGISPVKVYTHTVKLGAANSNGYTVNDVHFVCPGGAGGSMTGMADGKDGTALYSWAGFPAASFGGQSTTHGLGQNEKVRLMLENFNYGDCPSMTLSNLIPGAPYEICLYFASFSDPVRRQNITFFPGTPEAASIEIDVGQGRQGNEPTEFSRRVVHRYNADGNGQLVIGNAVVQGSTMCMWFFSNELLSAPLAVEGALPGMDNDVADPPFGLHFNIAPGSNFTATVAAVWTNNPANPTSIAYAAGWDALAVNESLVFTNAFSALGNTLNHTLPDVPFKIVWKFAVTNKLAVASGTGGSVSNHGGWVGEFDELEVLATPNTHLAFYKWEGDVPPERIFHNPLFLPGDQPREVKAIFAGVQHVATNGVDTNSGFSFDEPKLTIAKAVEVAAAAGLEYGLVLVSNGWHGVAATVAITNAVTVRGVADGPGGVHVFRDTPSNIHIFTLNHPGARLENVTVRGGVSGSQFSGGNIRIDAAGGVVSHCVITGGKTTGTGWGPFAGALYMNSPYALVTHCIITNNTAAGSAGRQTGGVFIDRNGGRLEHSLIAANYAEPGGYIDFNNDAICSGGLYLRGGSTVNCTVAGNSSGLCGGVFIKNDADALTRATLVNTVIAGNTATIEGANNANFHAWCGHNAHVNNCFTDTPAPINSSCHNEYPNGADVLLVDVPGGNYFPAPNSPILNASVPIANPPATDLAGRPRFRDGKMDAGCYQADIDEFTVSFASDVQTGIIPAQVVFVVTVGGTNTNDAVELYWDFDGSGFASPVSGQWVFTNTYNVAGTYAVTLHATATDGNGTRDDTMTRSGHIQVAPSQLFVVLEHGPGKEAAEPFDHWDIAATNIQEAIDYAVDGCEIILGAGTYPLTARVEIEKGVRFRGGTGKPGDVVLANPNPASALQILYINHEDAWVDGMVLQGGRSTEPAGGNLYIDGRGGTVSNCVIRGGHTSGHASGSGAYIGSRFALLTHCVVTNNIAEPFFNAVFGQAIVAVQGGRVENCLFAHNRWALNTAGNNTGVDTMAILELRGGVVTVRNCTLAGNTVTGRGAIFVNGNASSSIVTNCVIAGNLQWDAATGPAPLWSGHNRVFSSTVDETGVALHPGVEVEEADKIFRNVRNGDFHLRQGSLAVNAGPRVSQQEADAAGVDLDGNPRIYGFHLDHGCYELQHAGGTLLMLR